MKSLDALVRGKSITSYSETAPYTNKASTDTQPATFSAVIATVEYELDDTTISEALKAQGINHRYCKRIIARATNKPTTLMRIISGCTKSFEKLMNEGFFYLHKHYPSYPSTPPAPAPQPCSKCLQFTHTTSNCPNDVTCDKCNGNHKTIDCITNFPAKCSACNSTEHAAWSFKCPKRPTAPIAGIPNTTIKSINKKSAEIDKKITEKSHIHAPITIHDHIINTYINKVNKRKNTCREELIAKLKQRFIIEFKVDTSVVFSGSRMYILMFSLENPELPSPTETTTGVSYVTSNG